MEDIPATEAPKGSAPSAIKRKFESRVLGKSNETEHRPIEQERCVERVSKETLGLSNYYFRTGCLGGVVNLQGSLRPKSTLKGGDSRTYLERCRPSMIRIS